MATTETVNALDPIAGTTVTTTSVSYYLSGSVTLVCGRSTTVTQTFGNRNNGKKRSSVTTLTTVVLVPPAPRATTR
jgi:hypothetical protein